MPIMPFLNLEPPNGIIVMGENEVNKESAGECEVFSFK